MPTVQIRHLRELLLAHAVALVEEEAGVDVARDSPTVLADSRSGPHP